MSDNIIQLNQDLIHTELKDLVKNSVEETLNAMLDAEADKLVQAERYARDEQRQGYRAGHYDRSFATTAGEVNLRMPKLKGVAFETAIIERYRRRESSVEEALIEMYLAGVSVRRVEDITEALWGTKVSPGTISNLNKKAYENIEKWRNRPLSSQAYPYVYVDGIFLKRCWGEEFENVSILIAIGVTDDGYREILGAAEGLKEDLESWKEFFVWLKSRGLSGVKLVIGDKALGMVEAIGQVFPEAKYQRCIAHFYRNVFSVVPKQKVKEVAKMLKAIHAQEDREAALEKTKAVVEKLRKMKLTKAAGKVDEYITETLTYMSFPEQHWTRIRTNNTLERLNREIKRRTKVVGTFPDGQSALMLVCARLRHVTSSEWGTKRYLNMDHLHSM
ncbi:MAG: IS256 family transposase, partial [Lachnospiraceae bacterium]|nr:IS256 family transposase [Lachnospiraceae bacterium]